MDNQKWHLLQTFIQVLTAIPDKGKYYKFIIVKYLLNHFLIAPLTQVFADEHAYQREVVAFAQICMYLLRHLVIIRLFEHWIGLSGYSGKPCKLIFVRYRSMSI